MSPWCTASGARAKRRRRQSARRKRPARRNLWGRSDKLVDAAKRAAAEDPKRRIAPSRFEEIAKSMGIAYDVFEKTMTHCFDVFTLEMEAPDGLILASAEAGDAMRAAMQEPPGESCKGIKVFYKLKD